MSGLRGVFAGTLALAALQRLLSSQQGAGRVGGLLQDVGGLARRALSPDVPTLGMGPWGTDAPTSTGGSGTAGLTATPGGGFRVTPAPASVPPPQVAPPPGGGSATGGSRPASDRPGFAAAQLRITPGWRPAAPATPATVYTT